MVMLFFDLGSDGINSVGDWFFLWLELVSPA